jgi:hypothetical protein
MGDQGNAGYIELISCIPPTDEERMDTEYKPKLKVNSEALKIISEQFTSPISILVFIGDMGVGKSKLASLTVSTLLQRKYDKSLLPFQSAVNTSNVTRGVWMWRLPLKHLNNKKGSILILDCEGVNSYNKNISADLYLFCMLISTVFGVILGHGRVDSLLSDRLYNGLSRFEQMKTPCVLPNLWLVPLDLPRLKDNGKVISEFEWVQKVFSSNIAEGTLSKTDTEVLEARFNYIREKLRKIDVANITYLPHVFKEDDFMIDDLFTMLREKSNEEYYKSLYAAIERFTLSAGKRLPGSSSPTLFVRPAELAQLINDLIDVINKDKISNPDELIGKYLLQRFKDEVVIQKETEYKKELLLYTEDYGKKNLKKKETDIEKNKANNDLKDKRNFLINKYIEQMKKLAETKIYGSGSILLNSDLFINNLNEVIERMNHYSDPEILFNEIRSIHNSNDQNDQTSRQERLSGEMRKKMERIIDRIYREERINESLEQSELQIELEQCKRCGRSADCINITHSKKFCPSKRKGNYYRYNNEPDTMVCNACRELENISRTSIKCRNCGANRGIASVH